MKLPCLFKNKETTTLAATVAVPWQYWPSCKHPKTLSFRDGSGSGSGSGRDNMFKTVNSVFFDPIIMEGGGPDQSWFANSSSSSDNQSTSGDRQFTTTESDEDGGEESLEMVVRGARSERLFFEPEDTSSMVDKAKAAGKGGETMNPLLKERYVVVLAGMESEDPLKDFRRSMEEMVECHGLSKDWECLEELLGWYLKVNQKKNHGFIVAAFVDLLVALSAAASRHNYYYSTSFSSAISSFSRSSPLSSSFQGQEDEIAEQVEITMS